LVAWRELDTDYYAHLMRALIDMLVPVGPGDYASAMLAATLRGTLTELSFEIAQSVDQVLARREALIVVDKLLNSLAGTPRETPPAVPDRIGIGQLRASASTLPRPRGRRRNDRCAAPRPRRGALAAASRNPDSGQVNQSYFKRRRRWHRRRPIHSPTPVFGSPR
jgi:hypothetical protein